VSSSLSPLDVGSRKIAIVDDCEDNIAVLEHLLKRMGYTDIVSFNDSMRVLPICEEKGIVPDLFLLDVMMPKLNGIELAQKIKAESLFSRGAIIFVTAREMDDTLEKCFEVGGVDFVSKPISMIELRCRLMRAFEMQDIQRRLLLQNEELRLCTLTDPLTDVFNRRYLDRRLDEECAKSQRYQHELSFLMLDLDNFKRVNDECGHPTGDRVLRQLADILKDAVRSTDLVARYGGEEFSVMLTGTSLERALESADRIRQRVELTDFLPEREDLKVTVSIGVASHKFCGGGGVERLVAAADAALYDAKKQGKNRALAYKGDSENPI
jgi:diguanylate cyclase (GGDEF)-like protein